MAELGEISVRLTAKTQSFDRSMRSAAETVGSASKAAAGLALAAGAAAAALAGSLAAAAADVVKQVAAMGDAAAKAAGRMGTTAETVQELKHAAELSGSSVEDVEKAFVKLAKNANDTTKGIGTAKDAFRDLGISVTDAGGSLKSNETLFMETAQAISEMENQTQKVAFAQEIFGKSGTKLIPMLNAGAEGIAAMREEARELGIVMSNDAAATSERFNDTLDKLNKSFEGVKVSVGVALLPAFTKLADIALSVTKEILGSADAAKFMDDAIAFVTRQVLNLIDGLITFATPIAAFGTGIYGAVQALSAWFDGFTIIGQSIGIVATTIAQFVTGTLSGFIGAAGEVAEALGQDGIASALKTAEDGIAGFADSMGDIRGKLLEGIVDDMEDVQRKAGNVADAFGNLISGDTTEKIRGAAGRIRESVEAVGTATLDTAKKFDDGMQAMAKSAEDNSEKIVTAMQAAQKSILDALGAATGAAQAAGESLVGGGSDLETIDSLRAQEKSRAEGRSEVVSIAEGAMAQPVAAEEVGKLAAVSAELKNVFQGLVAGGGGLVGKFTELWQNTEGFQRAAARLSELFNNVFGPIIEEAAGNLFRVLEPVFDLLDAFTPLLQLAVKAMNFFLAPLKVAADVVKKFTSPIRDAIDWIRRFVNQIRVSIANLGRVGKGNKAKIDPVTGEIIDPKGKIDGSFKTYGEAREAHGMRETVTRRNVSDGEEAAADSLGDVADAARDFAKATREATGALTNVPVIFRTNLRRAQAGGSLPGSTEFGRDTLAGERGLNALASGRPGGIYVAGNIIVPGATTEEITKNLERQQFVKTGAAGASTSFGLVSGLATAG